MKAARTILLALALCWVFPALADVAVPPLVGRVVDQTGTLSSSDVESLNQMIRAFETRKGSQVAVLIVPTTEPESIEQYSVRVEEVWKIGRKKIDDGVLLVVAKNDRKLHIEVGYGFEGALTDATAKRIIDETITPRFRSGDFFGGISAGVGRIIGVIDGEKLPAAQPQSRQVPNFLLNHFDPSFALFALFAFGGLMRKLFGALLGATVTGGLVGLLGFYLTGSFAASLMAAFFVFVLAMVAEVLASANQGTAGRGRRGGWGDSSSSSGSSWSSGSSGSSWSSDSSSSDSGGGGGSSGGGGASGSW